MCVCVCVLVRVVCSPCRLSDAFSFCIKSVRISIFSTSIDAEAPLSHRLYAAVTGSTLKVLEEVLADQKSLGCSKLDDAVWCRSSSETCSEHGTFRVD